MSGFGIRKLVISLILKQTWVTLADSGYVRWLKVFQLYGGFCRLKTKVGFYVKGSSRVIVPTPNYYKGFTVKVFKKGSIIRVFLTHQVYNLNYHSTCIVKFPNNTGLPIKKKKIFYSKHLIGPGLSNLKNKKLNSLFSFSF
jgi:ribosomal protein L14